MDLDEIDHRILNELRRDARASMSAVARVAHISRASAYARVNKLTEAGVITGYSARIDPVRAGYHASAYVALLIDQQPWQDLRARLIEIPEVEHIALIGGEFDLMLLIRARDNADLRRIVLEEVHAIPSVRSTRTWLSFEDFDPQDERVSA